MDRHLIVIEEAGGNYSTPDVPRCIATGASREEAQAQMHEALQMHFEGLREDGLPFPQPSSSTAYVKA